MGQRKKGDDSQRLTDRMNCRLTPDEGAKIRQAARAHGLKVGDIVRDGAREYALRLLKRAERQRS